MSLSRLLAFLIGFGVGTAIESLTNVSIYEVLFLSLLAFALALLWRRIGKADSTPQLIILVIFLISCSVGLLRTGWYETKFQDTLQEDVGAEIIFSGQILKEPDRRSHQQLLQVLYKEVVVQVSTDNNTPVSYGDTITVIGKLKRPEEFETDYGRTFNYPGYLRAKGIEYTISFAEVEVLESGQGNVLIRTLLEGKKSFMKQLDQVLTEPAGSLADGLLLGLNQGLGEKLEEDFRRSGIIHIVVLSGYNIMLVVTFVLFLLSFFLRQRWRMVAGLVAIVCFALVVGLTATVVRASIMAGLLLIAQTFGRRYDVLRALLVAGFVMILINPYLLVYDIGFQLSFMATLGLIFALPWLGEKEQPEVLTSVKGYVVATIATQIAVLPLLIYHIGQVSLVAVFVNVLVLPAVPVAMLGAFVSALIYSVLPTIGLALGAVTQVFLSYIIAVAEWFSALPVAVITVSEISPWWMLGMYAFIGYLYWRLILCPKQSGNSVDDWHIVDEDEIKDDIEESSGSTEKPVPKMFR